MKGRIETLTATRGFAALMVVVFHFGTEVFPFNKAEQFFTGGNLGVSYFFVLSGFVLYYTYRQREISFGDFMKRRLARIAPLYYFALMLTVAIPLYAALKHGISPGGEFWRGITLNALFLQAYIPGYALSGNSPGWSLSIEMFFYLLFPLLLWVARKNERRFVVYAIAAYLLSQAIHLTMVRALPGNAGLSHDFVYYNPLWHLNGFMAGISGAILLLHTQSKANRFAPALSGILIILLINWRPLSLHNGLLAPVFVFFMIALAQNEPKVLKWSPLILLGEISYGIYLLQEPVHKYMVRLNDYLHLPYNEVFFYAYLAVLLVASTLSYYFIETPLRKKINGTSGTRSV